MLSSLRILQGMLEITILYIALEERKEFLSLTKCLFSRLSHIKIRWFWVLFSVAASSVENWRRYGAYFFYLYSFLFPFISFDNQLSWQYGATYGQNLSWSTSLLIHPLPYFSKLFLCAAGSLQRSSCMYIHHNEW